MKQNLFFLVFIVSVFVSNLATAQVQGGFPLLDSSTFTFTPGDSLMRIGNYSNSGLFGMYVPDTIHIDTTHADTTNTRLWQIGNTQKTFFADSTHATGIMTDTLNNYPVNANSWFTLKYLMSRGIKVSFWHKYQTTAGHDGGMVEFSLDSGITWQNVLGDCNNDSAYTIPYRAYVLTTNFYNNNDTLLTGEHAFSGISNGWVESQFQFYLLLIAYKTNRGLDSSCGLTSSSMIQVRFRFKSDATPDSLNGWIIGKINIEEESYFESVPNIYKPANLKIYPNPSSDAIFNFPVLDMQQSYTIEILNNLGISIINTAYKNQINLSVYPKGLYFYRVTNGKEYYSGKLVVE